MMPKRLVAFVTLSFLMALPTFAQRLAWDLGLSSTTGLTGVEIVDIEVDSEGNSYVLGNFSGSVSLNPLGLVPLTKNSFSNSNLFLAKYDRDGDLGFARAITGAGLIIGTDLVLDGDDFVYLTGSFEGSAVVETGGGGFQFIAATGNSDLFVIKYATGTLLLQWNFVAGGAADESGYGLSVDGGGDIFVTGGFSGTVDFDNAGPLAPSVSNGGEDIFLLKLQEATGNILERAVFGSTANDRGTSVACTSGTNLYLGGYFNGQMDINPTAVVFNIIPTGGQDGFLLRLDDGFALGLVNHIVIGGAGTDEVGMVKVSKSDLPYATVNFEQTANLGGGVTRTSNGSVDGLVIQYPVDLSLPNWATAIGGTGTDAVFAMTLDVCGNAFVTGSYQGTVDFDPGVGVANLTGPAGVNTGYFAAKYEEGTGSYAWAGGEEIAGRDNTSAAIALDRGGNAMLGVNASTAADTDVSVDGLNISRTPPILATGTIAYLTRSATGNVIVDETAAIGIGTFDAAMDWVEWNTTPDTVCFCLTGTPPFIINKPEDTVAVVADSTSIYGTTQNGWYLGSIVLNGPGGIGIAPGISIEGVETEISGLTIQNYDVGISLTNSLNYRIGFPNRGNQVISNLTYGIQTTGSYGTIVANEIGTDAAAATNLANGTAGISFDAYPAVTTIGGLGAGEQNIIGFNPVGVEDITGTTNATIVGNAFACNTGAGILITGGSFTPSINIAFVSSLSGTGPANTTIHLYEINNTTCGGTPPCQGFTYLGSTISDALGNWALAGAFTPGSQVTATATDAAGKTSEFSLCNIVTSILEPAFIELADENGLLSWTVSEDEWESFTMEADNQGIPVFSEFIEPDILSFQPSVSGSYVLTGLLKDGRRARSNAVEVTVDLPWRAVVENDLLTFGRDGSSYRARISDSQGRTIWEGNREGMVSLAVDSWSAGMYVITISDTSGPAWRKKILLR